MAGSSPARRALAAARRPNLWRRDVLFLLNDVIVETGSVMEAPTSVAARLATLDVEAVVELVQESFAKNPNFPHASAEGARRAALMLMLKAPQLNAALFVAPHAGCAPLEVSTRFASVSGAALQQLKDLQDEGKLTAAMANACVWACAAAE
jgi:hypothetical protein